MWPKYDVIVGKNNNIGQRVSVPEKRPGGSSVRRSQWTRRRRGHSGTARSCVEEAVRRIEGYHRHIDNCTKEIQEYERKIDECRERIQRQRDMIGQRRLEAQEHRMDTDLLRTGADVDCLQGSSDRQLHGAGQG